MEVSEKETVSGVIPDAVLAVKEETDPEALKVFRRCWCLGSQEFKQQMLQKVEGRLGEHHSGSCGARRRRPRLSALSPKS